MVWGFTTWQSSTSLGLQRWQSQNLRHSMAVWDDQHWQTTYPLVMTNTANWKITMLFMGKSTISTGPFSSSQTVSLPEGSETCLCTSQMQQASLRRALKWCVNIGCDAGMVEWSQGLRRFIFRNTTPGRWDSRNCYICRICSDMLWLNVAMIHHESWYHW